MYPYQTGSNFNLVLEYDFLRKHLRGRKSKGPQSGKSLNAYRSIYCCWTLIINDHINTGSCGLWWYKSKFWGGGFSDWSYTKYFWHTTKWHPTPLQKKIKHIRNKSTWMDHNWWRLSHELTANNRLYLQWESKRIDTTIESICKLRQGRWRRKNKVGR